MSQNKETGQAFERKKNRCNRKMSGEPVRQRA